MNFLVVKEALATEILICFSKFAGFLSEKKVVVRLLYNYVKCL